MTTKKKAPKKRPTKKRPAPASGGRAALATLQRENAKLRREATMRQLLTSRHEAAVAAARAERDAATKYRDQAFRERDILVRALSTVWESDLIPVNDRLNWNWAVCIHAPTGQLTWRISNELAAEFYAHLPKLTANHWDGTNIKTKYARLAALVPSHSGKLAGNGDAGG